MIDRDFDSAASRKFPRGTAKLDEEAERRGFFRRVWPCTKANGDLSKGEKVSTRVFSASIIRELPQFVVGFLEFSSLVCCKTIVAKRGWLRSDSA